MNEFAILLWAMTVSRYQWPMPAKEPQAVVEIAPETPERATSEERSALKQALERIARCSTGKLVRDHQSGLYIPETKKRCK